MPFAELERWERGYGMGVDGCDLCVEVGKCWCKLRRCLPFTRRDCPSGCVYDGVERCDEVSTRRIGERAIGG